MLKMDMLKMDMLKMDMLKMDMLKMDMLKKIILVLAVLISPLLSATVFDDYTPSDTSQSIGYNVLGGSLDASGYELREYSYIAVNGSFITKQLYFISSEQGVLNAFNNGGLSYEAYQDLLQDYNNIIYLTNIVDSSDPSINGIKLKEFITQVSGFKTTNKNQVT